MNEINEKHLRAEVYNPPQCFTTEGFTVGKFYTILNEKPDLNNPIGMSYTIKDDTGNIRKINSGSFECGESWLSHNDASGCDFDVRNLEEVDKTGWDGVFEESSHGQRTFTPIDETITLLKDKVAKTHVHDQAAVLAGIINYNQDTLFSVVEKELENIDDCLARIECSQSVIKQKLQYIKSLAVIV